MQRGVSTYVLPVVAVLVLGAMQNSAALAQMPRPLSLPAGPGVHVFAYDGRAHKSAEHYNALCRVVLKEFGIHEDSLCVTLVFVDADLQEKLNDNNPDRFVVKSWYGVSIKPGLIMMLGEDESDDTFLHEFMHLLVHRGVLFQDIAPSEVHHVIEMNEGLLLGSKSYLEFLKAK